MDDHIVRYGEVDWAADPDWEFHSALEEPLEDNLARYTDAIERCRQIAAGHALGRHRRRHQPSATHAAVRLPHLIEESARHLGHLDVLREPLDGTTGE